MKIALLAVLIVCPAFLQAGVVQVISPNHPQTFSYSDITWHSLRWEPGRNELVANITFSNYNYVTHYEPLMEEEYQFDLPGVKFDPATNTFFARTSRGQRVPVAALTKSAIGQSIKPLAGTVIHVVKKSGKVTVILVASNLVPYDEHHLHWIEENEGFFFNNLLGGGGVALR